MEPYKMPSIQSVIENPIVLWNESYTLQDKKSYHIYNKVSGLYYVYLGTDTYNEIDYANKVITTYNLDGVVVNTITRNILPTSVFITNSSTMSIIIRRHRANIKRANIIAGYSPTTFIGSIFSKYKQG